MKIELKKNFNRVLTLDNDFRNSFEKSVSPYGINQNSKNLVEFSSATVNHPSVYSYSKVSKFFIKNKDKFENSDFFIKIQKNIKTKIKRIFNNNVSCVYLCPSGTDAEYLPLLGEENKILNIVIGIDEIGTSIKKTSKGLVFSAKAPFGYFKKKGIKLRELKNKKIKTIFLPLTTKNFKQINEITLQNKIEKSIITNYLAYEKIILHFVYGSKTQKILPNINFIKKINTKFRNVKIVVDACQMRTGKKTINNFLKNGFDIIITGSKFFSSPPFCAAYLTNEKIKKIKGNLDLKKIINDFELIENPKISYGLLLRWMFALNEMETFYKIPEKNIFYIAKNLQKIIYSSLNEFNNILLNEKKLYIKSNKAIFENFRTIFLILLKHNEKFCTLNKSLSIYKDFTSKKNLLPLVSPPMNIKINGRYVGNFRLSISASHIISINRKIISYSTFERELNKCLNHIKEKLK